MSAQISLPRRMRPILPENGYESPRSPDDDILFGQGIPFGERRRVGRTKSSDRRDDGEERLDSRAYLNESSGFGRQKSENEKGEKSRTGLRDRVGCFTWTWFTMTMATGGISNVLHSSKYNPIPWQSSALINCSTIPIRLVADYWHCCLYL
jgi:hypothetical protein